MIDSSRELNYKLILTNFILIWLLLFTFVLQRPVIFIAYTVLLGSYCAWANRKERLQKILIASISMLVLFSFPALFKIYHNGSAVFYLFSTIIVFMYAELITRNINSLYTTINLIFYTAVVLIFYFIYKYWGNKEPLGMIVPGSSTNGIPAYLIVVQIFHSVLAYTVRGRLPISTAFLTFVVAFFGSGRGSLVVAGGILAFSFFFEAFIANKPHGIVNKIQRLIIFSLILVLVINIAELSDYVIRHTKLSVGLIDENRIGILDSYFHEISVFEILFGRGYEGTIVDSLYGGNPHIAYIRLHSFFGLFAVLLVLASPFFLFLWKSTVKSMCVFFSLLFFALLRSLTEPILFPTLLDLFYIGIFFIFVRHGRFPEKMRLKYV